MPCLSPVPMLARPSRAHPLRRPPLVIRDKMTHRQAASSSGLCDKEKKQLHLSRHSLGFSWSGDFLITSLYYCFDTRLQGLNALYTTGVLGVLDTRYKRDSRKLGGCGLYIYLLFSLGHTDVYNFFLGRGKTEMCDGREDAKTPAMFMGKRRAHLQHGLMIET